MRRVKIVGTLGPASSTEAAISDLIDAGLNVARVNASHGDNDQHKSLIEMVRKVSTEKKKSVAILFDIQGPKIRVGKFANNVVELLPGQPFTITTDSNVIGDNKRVSTTHKNLTTDVKPGDQILLDDGYLTLQVVEISGNDVVTQVIAGGQLKNNKGINLPSVAVSAPAITEKDRRDIAFGMKMRVDYLALSFVRSPQDVLEAKQLATINNFRIPVIAKIEKPQAIDELSAIVTAADGIMVARGDLGVELGAEKVPMLQKHIIEETNAQGKVVITATQMLESMIHHSKPTRAEASDVANAVMDGSDAVMLSGETAVGEYPIECVQTMSRIIQEVEDSEAYRKQLDRFGVAFRHTTNAIAHAAVTAAKTMSIDTIVCISESGGAPRLTGEYRPQARIIALTSNEVTFHQLALQWGVEPFLIEPAVSIEEMLERIETLVTENQIAATGEKIVITMGIPIGSGESTNMLKIHEIPAL